jgi:hypothetical protein
MQVYYFNPIENELYVQSHLLIEMLYFLSDTKMIPTWLSQLQPYSWLLHHYFQIHFQTGSTHPIFHSLRNTMNQPKWHHSYFEKWCSLPIVLEHLYEKENEDENIAKIEFSI